MSLAGPLPLFVNFQFRISLPKLFAQRYSGVARRLDR
jgi:hypothetical protein